MINWQCITCFIARFFERKREQNSVFAGSVLFARIKIQHFSSKSKLL